MLLQIMNDEPCFDMGLLFAINGCVA